MRPYRDAHCQLAPSRRSSTVVAPVVVQLKVDWPPGWMVSGLASKRTICGLPAGAAPTVTVTEAVVLPPAPVAGGVPDSEAIWDQLKKVYDPEIPVNIVDLGLVYSMEVDQPPDGSGYHVTVTMTLTAPGCGMGPAIAEDARSKVVLVPGVSSADVRLVWEPPWNQSMISEEGKMRLGLV